MSAASAKPGADRLGGLDAMQRETVAAAMASLQHGDARSAAGGLDAVLAQRPAHPEVLRLRALADLQLGDAAAAVARLQAAHAYWPDDGLVATQLGGALAQAGDLEAAERCLRVACAARPGLVDAWYNLGLVLDARMDTAAAREAFARVLAIVPGHAPARLRLAELDRVVGDFDAARAAFRAVLDADPDSVPAWVGLAAFPDWQPTDAELARLLALRDSARVPAAQVHSLAFTCATLLERAGRHDEAFAAWLAANAHKRRTIAWDAAAVHAWVEAVLAAFPAAGAGSPAGQGEGILFLVGMPRSGSTVLEQILAAHPRVAAGGERNALARLLQAESDARRQPFPQWVRSATAEDWHRLGARYLAEAAPARGDRPVFTDKTLSNWQLVGAIRCMLPGARIIECVRDPLDTVWSCFRHLFAEGQGFSYDLDELVAFHQDCRHALAVWRDRHPGVIVRHDHDALAAAPEAGIRALLEACALPFDPACLRFHTTRRELRTASLVQARQPLQPSTHPSRRHAARLAAVAARLGSPPPVS